MRMLWICVLLLSFSAFAQEPTLLPDAPQPTASVQPRDVRWDAVEALLPGESIELRDRTTGVRTGCVLDYVTETNLTCVSYDRGGPPRRVVYPHGEIDRVWVTRRVRGPSQKAVLIGAGMGAVIGGIAGGRASYGSAIGEGILIGSGLGGLAVLGSDPLGLRSHDQRVLIYRAR